LNPIGPKLKIKNLNECWDFLFCENDNALNLYQK